MDDYFERVVVQLVEYQTLYTATTGTPRIYDGVVISKTHRAIRYFFIAKSKKNRGYIRKPFLNAAQAQFAAGHIPTRPWCLEHGMDPKPCSYRVTLQILTDYPNP